VKLIDQGYAGIDIDWEPLDKADQPMAALVANRVRQARPGAILTVPVESINTNIPPDLANFASLAAAYDQVNIMSYGMAGAYSGWKSWHSSPLYQQQASTPMSIHATVQAFLAASVPAGKIGVGVGFYGICYTSPVTGPAQDLNGSIIAASDGQISFKNIMTSYYDAGARHFDAQARATFLSFSSARGPSGCTYISYDDEQSIQEKAAYVKNNGLGGVMQWEINEGYLPTAPAGSRNPLLSAVRDYVLH
jgi:chitinase